jgi:hypothetical protein
VTTEDAGDTEVGTYLDQDCSSVSFVSHVVEILGKALVLIGLVIAGLGLLIMAGLPIGRLPGDFYVKRGSFSFYFPLATSIILSILLTLLLAFFRR